MKLKSKLILALTIELVVLPALPLVAVKLSDPLDTMGLMMILFFIVNPAASVTVNLFTGKDVKKLWWIPILFAIVFLSSYWVALEEIVWDLSIYAAIYMLLGFLTMAFSWIAKRN